MPARASVEYEIQPASARSLTVAGDPAEYGSPAPLPYGIHTNIADGTWVTSSVPDAVVQPGVSQHTCGGWSLEYGAVTNVGAGTQAVFELTADSSLTWRWQTCYWLDTETVGIRRRKPRRHVVLRRIERHDNRDPGPILPLPPMERRYERLHRCEQPGLIRDGPTKAGCG